MTRLSCHRFRANEVRLWLSVIAYNLGNLWRRLALPAAVANWSLTSLGLPTPTPIKQRRYLSFRLRKLKLNIAMATMERPAKIPASMQTKVHVRLRSGC